MKVLAYLETVDGQLKKTAFEALTAAHSIAQASGGSVVGIAFQSSESALSGASGYGLTSCVHISGDAFSKPSTSGVATAIAETATKENADVVILPASSTGKEIAARLAVKLEAGLISDAVELSVQGADLVAVRPVYAGKARIQVKVLTAKKVVTIRPNVFTPKAVEGASVSVQAATPALNAVDTTYGVQSTARNTGKLDVAEADIIVSGGRGLKESGNFHLVESLAGVLGAAVGASRAVVDAGWRPHGEQVGQTGKTVSPSLYVACGISGAVQHLAGMSSSKIIVAINKDKDAPIFQIADYGLVGDVFEVLPKLTDKIKAAKG